MSIKEFAKEKNESIRAVIHEAEEGGYWSHFGWYNPLTKRQTVEQGVCDALGGLL